MPNWCAPQVSTGVNVSVMVLQGRKSSPQKSRPPESGHRRHGVWIAIEYSYKLGQKKEFKFLCVTGWFSQIRSHIAIWLIIHGSVIAIVIQRIKDDPELKKAVMETLAPVPTPSSASFSIITPSISPSSVGAPSVKAMGLTTEGLCQWLKDIKVDVKYIECFREEDVDGSELATYDDSDLQGLGISEQRIRKKIMVQFRKIT